MITRYMPFFQGILEIQQHIPGKEIISYCIKNNIKIVCPARTLAKRQQSESPGGGYKPGDIWSGNPARKKIGQGFRILNADNELEQAFYAL